MAIPFYYLTLLNVTTTEIPQTEKNVQAILVDFSNVFISGVEDPKTELRTPVWFPDVPVNEKVQVNVTKKSEKHRLRKSGREKMRVVERKEGWDLDPRQEILSRTYWSDCQEFDKEASFHPALVIDVAWVPVYAWSLDGVDCFIHKFLVPTVELVEHYKSTFGPYVNRRIDWSQPKMVLSMLITEKILIAEGRRGKFKVIEKMEMPEQVPSDFFIPVTTVQFKLKGSYLAMMCCDCDHPYSVVFGDHEGAPWTTQEKISAAQSFGIKGLGAPVTYDADEEQSVRRAMRNHQEQLMAKQTSVLKGHFPYDGSRDIKDSLLSTGIHLEME